MDRYHLLLFLAALALGLLAIALLFRPWWLPF